MSDHIPDAKKKERGIIFSGQMVRQILAGKKTQTRRAVKFGKQNWTPILCVPHSGGGWRFTDADDVNRLPPECCKTGKKCPYGKVGDRLWCKETFAHPYLGNKHYKTEAWRVSYRADGELKNIPKWTASLFMPRKYSRITLEIIGLRAERLQEITEEDAKAEGFDDEVEEGDPEDVTYGIARLRFSRYWDSLNAKRGYNWTRNPWVFVISFKEIGQGRRNEAGN